jgi:hypothetical protein
MLLFDKKFLFHRKLKQIFIILFTGIVSTNAMANFILECTTTKILKMGGGVPPQPIGGVFQFNSQGTQAWSAPFHTSLLFRRVKAEPTGDGGDRALFSAQGLNMPEALILLEITKKNTITITASQDNTSIRSSCKDITSQVTKNNQDAAKKAEEEQFSDKQLEEGQGWYLSRFGKNGYSLNKIKEEYNEYLSRETRLAVMRSVNDANPSSDHYLMLGPYSIKSEVETALSRIEKEKNYSSGLRPRIIKIGERQLKGNSYADNVHIIIQKSFKKEPSIGNHSNKASDSENILKKIILVNDEFFVALARLVAYADKNILAQPDSVYSQVKNFSNNILSSSDTTGIFIKYSSEKDSTIKIIDKNVKNMDKIEYEKWIQIQVQNNVERFNNLNNQRNSLISQYNEAIK